MEHMTTLREWLGALLRTNKLVILAELVLVLAPTCTGMILGPRSGRDFVPLGGSAVLLGAPLVYLGGLLGFGLVLISLWLRGKQAPGTGFRYSGGSAQPLDGRGILKAA